MKRMASVYIVLFALTLAIVPFLKVEAQESSALILKNFWARQTIPGVKPGVVYGEIVNNGDQPLVFKAVTGDVAARIEIHDHIHDNGVMRMRKVDYLEIPAGETLMLKPGGKHIMLYERNRDMHPGESYDFTLSFEGDISQNVTAQVVQIGKKPVFEEK